MTSEFDSSIKLDLFGKDRLSLVDLDFIEKVQEDLQQFAIVSKQQDYEKVFIFPPVNNYRRFLIHKLVESNFPDLKTFSIGEAEQRRTCVCFLTVYRPNGHVNKTEMPALGLYMSPSPPVFSDNKQPLSSEKKKKRPDRQVYVPRARRKVEEEQAQQDTKIQLPTNLNINENQVPEKNESKEDKEDWDSLYDDNGERVDVKLMEELTASVGKVQIEKSDKERYSAYVECDSKGVEVVEKYPHVIEVYGFPVEFKTQDLMVVFGSFHTTTFEIRWVDDTHALVVFTSVVAATEALRMKHPLVKTRPLSSASAASQAKARRIDALGALHTNEPRPDTCAVLAKRMVSAALGMRAPGRTREENMVLQRAREKKKERARIRDEVWDGDGL